MGERLASFAHKPWINFSLLPIGSDHLHIAELFTGKGIIVEWSHMALTNHQGRISVGETMTVSITVILPFHSSPPSLFSASISARLEHMGSSKGFSVGDQKWSKCLLLSWNFISLSGLPRAPLILRLEIFVRNFRSSVTFFPNQQSLTPTHIESFWLSRFPRQEEFYRAVHIFRNFRLFYAHPFVELLLVYFFLPVLTWFLFILVGFGKRFWELASLEHITSKFWNLKNILLILISRFIAFWSVDMICKFSDIWNLDRQHDLKDHH